MISLSGGIKDVVIVRIRMSSVRVSSCSNIFSGTDQKCNRRNTRFLCIKKSVVFRCLLT